MEYDVAYPFAVKICDNLKMVCEKICLAGSVRRMKQQVHDLELVLLPRYDKDIFEQDASTYSELDSAISHLIVEGMIAWDTTVKRNGPRLKRFVVPALGNAILELYIANRNNFGVIHAIRTGDADFSRTFMTPRSWRGLMPDTMACIDGHLWRFRSFTSAKEAREMNNTSQGELICCYTESQFFEALGIRNLDRRFRNEEGIHILKKEIHR